MFENLVFISNKKSNIRKLRIKLDHTIEELNREDVSLGFFVSRRCDNSVVYKYTVRPKADRREDLYSVLDAYLVELMEGGVPIASSYRSGVKAFTECLAGGDMFFEYAPKKDGCTKREKTVRVKLDKLDKVYKDCVDQDLYFRNIEKFSDMAAVSSGSNKLVRNVVVVDIDHNNSDGTCSFESLKRDYDNAGLGMSFLIKRNTESGHFQLYLFLNKGLLVKRFKSDAVNMVDAYVSSMVPECDTKVEFDSTSLLEETADFNRYKALTRYLNSVMHGDTNFKMWRIKNPAADLNNGHELETYILYRNSEGQSVIEPCDYMDYKADCAYDFDQLYDSVVPTGFDTDCSDMVESVKFNDSCDDDDDIFTEYKEQKIEICDFTGHGINSLIKDIDRLKIGRETFIMNRVLHVLRNKYQKFMGKDMDRVGTMKAEADLKDAVVKTVMSEFKKLMVHYNGVFPGTVNNTAHPDSHYEKLACTFTKKAIATYDPEYVNGGKCWNDEDRRIAVSKRQSESAIRRILICSYIYATLNKKELTGSLGVTDLRSDSVRSNIMYFVKSSNMTKLSKEIVSYFTEHKNLLGKVTVGGARSVYNILSNVKSNGWSDMDTYLDSLCDASESFDEQSVSNNFYAAVINGVLFRNNKTCSGPEELDPNDPDDMSFIQCMERSKQRTSAKPVPRSMGRAKQGTSAKPVLRRQPVQDWHIRT